MKKKLLVLTFLMLSMFKVSAQGEMIIGQICMFAGNFAPYGWLYCEGQELQIADYDVLYSVIGTTYGGDGFNTFKLPDFRGRVPIHTSASHPLGQSGGEATHALTTNEMPAHTHAIGNNSVALAASSANGTVNSPKNNYYAVNTKTGNEYAATTNLQTNAMSLAPTTVGVVGGSQPHNNQKPFLTIGYIICYEGIYPSRP